MKAYCESKGRAGIEIIESNVNIAAGEITGKIYEAEPDIAAFSCYIWNIEYINRIGSLLKKLIPHIIIILGGPEVSFEEDLSCYPFTDYIVRGAGEETFYGLLCRLDEGNEAKKAIIDGCSGSFNNFPSPYTEAYFQSFGNIPVEHMLIYYESSRGCVFSCAYCLSSAAQGICCLDTERVKTELQLLIGKGAKCIKFVDRTFNSNAKRAGEILRFILTLDTDCTFHFEAAADLFGEQLLNIIEKMPAGRVQFEIGIQSVNEKTLNAVNRKTDTELAIRNIGRLVSFRNCHIHTDLIAGLPYETIETFRDAVNRCISCRPHMLQLGFLKMLKGTEMRREYAGFGAVFAEFPPYEVYKTDTLSYGDIIKLKKIESVIDKFYNCGMFESAVNYALTKVFETPYGFFEKLADYCPDALNLKMTPRNAYGLLLNFLQKYGGGEEAAHHIKLDCLSCDCKGILPDGIASLRNKDMEALYRKQPGKKSANIRIEFFTFENKYKLFDYDIKNILTNRFEVRDMP